MKLRELLTKHALKLQLLFLCYFAIGLIYLPAKCEIGHSENKLISKQIYQPVRTALLTLGTGYQYPHCFGELGKETKHPEQGWYPATAKIIQTDSHMIYSAAVKIISSFVMANILWIMLGNLLLSRFKRKVK